MITFTSLGYQGFLGNQLFQYAMLKGVSAATGRKVYIPKRYEFIPEQTAWKQMGWVQLENFNLNCSYLTFEHYFKNKFVEKSFAFDERVFETKNNTDFSGYYQSYKYFENIEEIIRKEYEFVIDIVEKANDIIAYHKEKFNSSALVALHVRRGSYLKPPFNETHKVLSYEYYNKAMSYFPKLNFCIFSDDIEWCKIHFVGEKFSFINTNNHWLDLCIMSKLDHQIISASTYSWWGAWLNKNIFKNVVCPNTWFGEKFQHYDTSALIPTDWIKI